MSLFVVPSGVTEDAQEEPFFAFKLGPASCYCMCVPDSVGAAGADDSQDAFDDPAGLGASSSEHSASIKDLSPPRPGFSAPEDQRQGTAAASAGEVQPSSLSPEARTKLESAMAAASSAVRVAGTPAVPLAGAVPARAASVAADVVPAKPQLPPQVNGCGCEFDLKTAEASGVLTRSDPIQEHYKKSGFFGAVTGAFGDKKTMYCHHLTADGQIGTRAAKKAGVKCTSVDEVWQVLGKDPCYGRFAYDRASGKLKCGKCVEKDHDDTCNKETCLFKASGLQCPTPEWALK